MTVILYEKISSKDKQSYDLEYSHLVTFLHQNLETETVVMA